MLETEQIPENKDQIETSIAALIQIITEAIVKSTPLKDSSKRTEKLPDNILNLIHERNKLRTENNKRPTRQLKSAINEHRQKISALISAYRCKTWNNKVENLKIKDNTLYRMTKVLTKTRTQIPPLKDDNNELKFFSPSDKGSRKTLLKHLNRKKIHRTRSS